MGGLLKMLALQPTHTPSTIVLNDERIIYWLGVGAQPTEAVDGLFKQVGLWERYERFKAGEDLEALVAEAEKIYKTRVSDLRTNPPQTH